MAKLKLQEAVLQLVTLGSLPSESAEVAEIEACQIAIERLVSPLTDDEARALVVR